MKITFTSVSEEDIKFYKKNLKNYDLSFYKTTIEKVPIKEIKNTDILSVFIFDKLNKKLLSKFDNLKLIITRSAGYDHIDLDFCKENRIKVAHIPFYSPKSIAEHTIALMLTLTRRLNKISSKIKRLDFSQSKDILGKDLDQLKAGIIGTGRIGSWTAKLCYSLGMKVYAHDIFEKEELKRLGIKYMNLEDILKKSDIISLHVPYTKETHHLINRKNISLLKRTAILINTSRGAVVDTDALYFALKQKKIAGAGLDVFEDEQVLILNKYEEGISSNKVLKIIKLSYFENVVITPHVAYFTEKSVKNIRKYTINCISQFISSGSLEKFEVVN